MGASVGAAAAAAAKKSSSSSSSSLLLHRHQQVLLNLLNVLVVVFLYPVVALLLLLPLYLHRVVAQWLAARDDDAADLGPILFGTSALFATPANFNRSASVLQPYFTFGQSLTLTHVSSVFEERVLCKRNPSSPGEYAFPQMRQRVVARYGYNFWANVEEEEEEPTTTSFQQHHFRYLDPADPYAKIKYSDLLANNHRLSQVRFPPERSPWEVILVPNVEKEGDPSVKCVVIWRIHHCLADGFTLTNLMGSLAFSPAEDFRGKSAATNPMSSSILTPLMAVLRAPYYIAKSVALDADRNDWVLKARTGWQGTVSRARWEDSFSLAELKGVAAQFRVSVSSVVILLVVGAVERGMRRRGDAIPAKIQVAMPLPLPGHPGVGNHHTAALIPVQMFPGQPLRTLKGIDLAYSNVAKKGCCSPIPLANYYVSRLLGGLPSRLIPSAERPLISSTCVVSNFASFAQKIDMFGVELKDFRMGDTLLDRHASCTYCVMYGGRLTFTTSGDRVIFPEEEDISHFAASFRHTFNSLQAETTDKWEQEQD